MASMLLFTRYDTNGDDRLSYQEFTRLVSDLICLRAGTLHAVPQEAQQLTTSIAFAAFTELHGTDKQDIAHEPPFARHPFVLLAERWQTPAVAAHSARVS